MADPVIQYSGGIARQLQLPLNSPDLGSATTPDGNSFADVLAQMYGANPQQGTTVPQDGIQAGVLTGRPDTEVSPVGRVANALEKRIDSVNEVMTAADDKIEAFVAGDDVSVHEVMVNVSKADLNFKLMTTVGRKVIEAYQDVMRMQV